MSSNGGINKLDGVIYCLMCRDVGKAPHTIVCTPLVEMDHSTRSNMCLYQLYDLGLAPYSQVQVYGRSLLVWTVTSLESLHALCGAKGNIIKFHPSKSVERLRRRHSFPHSKFTLKLSLCGANIAYAFIYTEILESWHAEVNFVLVSMGDDVTHSRSLAQHTFGLWR